MNKYIIYAWLGAGISLKPNNIKAENAHEAIEILCANCKANRMFIPIEDISNDDLTEYENDDRYTYVDSTMYGGECGYLLIENMQIREV